MECLVDRLSETAFGSPREQEEHAPLDLENVGSCPTPGEIIGQIGLVITVCLGLGLLARVLVAFVGVH
jgi:hypothetical protein